jgi:hypothetical protein
MHTPLTISRTDGSMPTIECCSLFCFNGCCVLAERADEIYKSLLQCVLAAVRCAINAETESRKFKYMSSPPAEQYRFAFSNSIGDEPDFPRTSSQWFHRHSRHSVSQPFSYLSWSRHDTCINPALVRLSGLCSIKSNIAQAHSSSLVSGINGAFKQRRLASPPSETRTH